MNQIEKEIQAVNNLIRLLNKCLEISLANRRIEEVLRIKNDLKTCNIELEKLLLKKTDIKNAILAAAEKIEIG